MKQYLDLVAQVLREGVWQENRTGVRTISCPGLHMRFDLQHEIPAITTKRLAFKSAMGELVGFLRGISNAAEFRRLGCKVWDQNANSNAAWLDNPYRQGEDDLGAIYGVQWRNWPAYKVLKRSATAQIQHAQAQGFQELTAFVTEDAEEVVFYKAIDQIRYCLDTIITQPGNRRILFHGWNCAQLDEMALPPCHLLYHFLPNPVSRELSLCLYMRSNDLALGTPFNLIEATALITLVGRLTGYQPRWLSYFIGDAHIYESHVKTLQQQQQRQPFPSPKLVLSARVPDYAQTGRYQPEWLHLVNPEDFELHDYQHHPALQMDMVV